ncbi:HEPN domain-containing protein [Dyella sp.]|uniref:ApeA N-terminal domain 1-containing protein n=1 Tax=Dyella sp. TaxID=1869338 RepID=UPI002ED5D9D7
MRTASGRFSVHGLDGLAGDLLWDGKQSEFTAYAEDETYRVFAGEPTIHGVLNDMTKVSLLECVQLSLTRTMRPEGQRQAMRFFPNFIVEGRHHVDAQSAKIRCIRFFIEDAADIFCDYGSFGSTIRAKGLWEQLVKDSPGEYCEPGEMPVVFFYSGRDEIIRIETSGFAVSAHHNVHWSPPSPSGLRLDNDISTTLDFNEPQSFADAIGHAISVVNLLSICAGRAQNWKAVEIDLEGTGFEPLRVTWNHAPQRVSNRHDDRRPHFRDLPLNPVNRPEEFKRVVTGWVSAYERDLSAWVRFSEGFALGSRYTIDRLVGAANIFDLLSITAAAELPSEFEEAKKVARAAFKKLPDSELRRNALDSIARIGKHPLTAKALKRAQVVLDASGGTFPELERVIKYAIRCRNYFVHGSGSPPVDIYKHRGAHSFLTDALEFVFVASHFIESGWDVLAFCRLGGTVSHPFQEFVYHYRDGLAELNAAMAMSPAPMKS